jgi:transcriptional regulator with XRE-family HTH domain
MGRSPRDHPKRLALKLRHIRDALDFTQEQMAEHLKQVKPSVRPGHVSELERGLREPTLTMLLFYARIAGVPIELLIDDKLDLPTKLPGASGYELIMKPVRVRRKN